MALANALYAKARQKFLNGEISWGNDTIVATLTNGTYLVDLLTHEFVSDLGAAEWGYPQVSLASKTTTLGVADAADVDWPGGQFASLAEANGVAIYKDTGTKATSPLIAFYGTLSSLPITPDGATDITMVWSNGTDKIFAL